MFFEYFIKHCKLMTNVIENDFVIILLVMMEEYNHLVKMMKKDKKTLELVLIQMVNSFLEVEEHMIVHCLSNKTDGIEMRAS